MSGKNILITGASGFIGKALIKALSTRGYQITILSTSQSDPKKNIFRWNPEQKSHEPFNETNFNAIINLAGASIADTRWNKSGQKQIKNSRVHSTVYLKKLTESFTTLPHHFISASAIGYYGLIDNDIKTESSPGGEDFAAMVCREWENAAHLLSSGGTQLSIIRIGIVLGADGGFFKKIKDLTKWNIAAPVGDGKQPVCWIHMDDLIQIFIEILENKLTPGTYNAVSNCDSNAFVTNAIAKKEGQKFLLPAIPNFILRILFGKKSEILTQSSRVSSSKLVESGFVFKHTNILQVISDLTIK